MRAIRHAVGCFLLLVLAACAAPATQAPPKPAPTTPVAAPQAAQPGARGGAIAVDASCKVDADCTVKDVGNCCGYYPACVNRRSPTDPAGVRARCAKSGMASVCGFRDISACACVQGKCAASGGGPMALPER